MWHDGACWLLTERDEPRDWVRNLEAEPTVTFEVAGTVVGTRASVAPDLPAGSPVRTALAAKYDGTSEDEPLGPWAAGALTVRIDP